MASQDQLWDLIASRREGTLTTISKNGRPQLSNVLYLADREGRTLRISTTADRLKARNLLRDPRASVHVTGTDFWHFAVAEGTATVSPIATAIGDETIQELHTVYSAFYTNLPDDESFAAEMIANRRLVIRIAVEHLHGVLSSSRSQPPRKPPNWT